MGTPLTSTPTSGTTFDVDGLVRETDAEVAEPAKALPVDLMLADFQTFAAVKKDSRRCDLGNGLSLAVPSALHLIAMKLHALRSPARFENGIDLQDVKYLIKAAKIDTSSKEFTDIAERYATDAIRKILREPDRE